MEDSTSLGYSKPRMYEGPTETDPMIAALRAVRSAPPAEREAFWDALRSSLSVTTPELEAEHGERLRQIRESSWSDVASVASEAVVYYLRFDSRVKIGYTTNLPLRLTAIPHDELLATEPGSMRDEKARHLEFSSLHVKGEWFRYEEPLVSHIAGLQ